MPIFMKAAAIDGDVVAESHKGWFQVEECSFDLQIDKDKVRARLTDSDQASEKPIEPEIGLFEVTKKTPGRSVPGLMAWIVSGDQLDEVRVDVCGDTTGDDGKWRSHMLYVLKGVLMKDYKMTMGDAEKGQMSIKMQFSYESLELTQSSYDRANQSKPSLKSSAVITKPQ
ncbi:MAG: type VI protein secretion system component Hcp [Planctomycetota bacterium]|jgi:type VI protein secretion system component Hcp